MSRFGAVAWCGLSSTLDCSTRAQWGEWVLLQWTFECKASNSGSHWSTQGKFFFVRKSSRASSDLDTRVSTQTSSLSTEHSKSAIIIVGRKSENIPLSRPSASLEWYNSLGQMECFPEQKKIFVRNKQKLNFPKTSACVLEPEVGLERFWNESWMSKLTLIVVMTEFLMVIDGCR